MILRLLRWWGARRPYFHIYALTPPHPIYMGRWWLFGGSNELRDSDEDRPEDDPRTWARGRFDAWVGRFLAARLHHIARADNERHHHDHPAGFVSLVVGGWYREKLPRDQKQPASLDVVLSREVMRRAGSIAFRRARDRHTIAEVSPGGCWTVVLWLPKWNRWGFYVDWGRVPAKAYFRGSRLPTEQLP